MKTNLIPLLFLTAASAAQGATALNGAGATFPYPLYSKWFAEYGKAHPDAEINYQSIGSGGGIRQFQEGTIDFGASDAPMTDEQLAKSPGVLHIPTALGAVVVTYSLADVNQSLNLTGDVLADIYLGKIQMWNDPRITKLNPGVKLADQAIMVVHRSDGSGTSAIFTDYLSKVSPEWKDKVGSGTAVNWPAGLGGKGNEGVTGLVKQSPGAIGYVELIYALNNKLPEAKIKNAAGQWVAPTVKGVTDAAAAFAGKMPKDYRVSITNAPGKTAYPISSFTYLLVHKEMAGDKGKALVAFLKWAVHEGQSFSEPLGYARLPQKLVGQIDRTIGSIQVK